MPALIPIDIVQTRLMRALKTIRVLPDKESRFQSYRTAWPEFARQFMDAYGSEQSMKRFRPTPFDVGDCLTALSWMNHIPQPDIKHIYWRSEGVSYRQVAEKIGRSHETARKRFEHVMVGVWQNANGRNR
ncbi:MAG: hypothetical protein GY941_16545 [Planctomycetes bacterium]|nr:hypothetical protein [Planctomycetota bacterium]